MQAKSRRARFFVCRITDRYTAIYVDCERNTFSTLVKTIVIVYRLVYNQYMEQNSFIVIDANSLVNRAFYAMSGMTTSRGEPVGALYGFTTMLIKLLEHYRPAYIAAAFDVHAPTFRHKLTPKYKATRKPMPDDLAAQMQPLKDVLTAMNIKTFELEGYEADDIIGTIARRTDVFTYILTGDRDSLQLVNDRTHALLTKKGITDILDVSPESVPDVFGVPVEYVVDFKALAGDSSDNIPGVAGIGDKSAVELITKYGALDDIYAALDEITGARKTKLEAGKADAYLSYELAKINTDVPIAFALDECKCEFPFRAEVREVFKRLEFKSLLSRAELFAEQPSAPKTPDAASVRKVELASLDELYSAISAAPDGENIAVMLKPDGMHFAFDGTTDYFAPIADNIMSIFSLSDCVTALSPMFYRRAVTFELKSLLHAVAPHAMPDADDIALMAYLLEYRLSPTTAAELFALRDECEKELEARGMTKLYRDIELPLLHILFEMEKTGFAVDRDRLDEIDAKLSELEQHNVKRISELSGVNINLNSPKQLAKLLFEDMGIPYPDKTAKTYSTKAEILQKLSGEYEIVDELLKYRFNSKLKSTFIDGLRKTLRHDGTVHTSFNQMATTTGRLSSTDPNLQNIPTRTDEGKLLRSMFVARKGNMLVDADYSQIELKLLAHFSGDPKMVEAFRSGNDIHAATAAEVFGVAPEEVTSQMRRDAKAVNFGIVYGISNYGLSQNIHIAPKKADEYIKRYFERYPAVKAYLDGLIESAKNCGYAVTMFGRRRNIPELNSSKFMERKFGERVAMNTPLQGSAADIIKIAMVRVRARLEGFKSKLIMQVHDELIVDASPDEVDRVVDIVKTEMENAVSLSVPLNVDVAVGKNWMECK